MEYKKLNIKITNINIIKGKVYDIYGVDSAGNFIDQTFNETLSKPAKVNNNKLPAAIKLSKSDLFNNNVLNVMQETDNKNQTEVMFDMIQNCVEEIHYGEDIYNKVDISTKELTEFFDSLNTEQFKNVSDFFESMPKLRHVVEVTNPETKVKGEVLIQGLKSFLV